MGDVHLARSLDPGVPSPVVVKRLHGELVSEPNIVRRFRHEAELAARIDSPYVAKVFDAGSVGDALYIAMEHIAGWPLTRVIAELAAHGGPPHVHAAARMMEGAIAGLAALHGSVDPATGAPLEIIHRDIAPKNIMIDEEGRSRLIDLGIGRSTARDWKTRTGVTVGTPGYMPPEQIFGDGIDHRADIYAAGVVLFELLTLTAYIERGPVGQMLQASRVVRPRAPSSVRGDVPRALDAVVMKAVALDPDDRFSSAAELFAALREAVPLREGPSSKVLVADLLWRELALKQTEVSALLHGANDTALLDTMASNPIASIPDVRMVRRGRMPRWLPFAVAIAGAAAGVGLGDVLRAKEPVRVEPVVETRAPPPPAVSAVERPPPIEVVPAPRPPPKEARAPEVKPSLPKGAHPAPPPPARADAASPRDLLARANDLRSRLTPGSARAVEANDLLRRINLGMASGDAVDWAELERRLVRLEQQ
jgi:serine/threonine-protein kinase